MLRHHAHGVYHTLVCAFFNGGKSSQFPYQAPVQTSASQKFRKASGFCGRLHLVLTCHRIQEVYLYNRTSCIPWYYGYFFGPHNLHYACRISLRTLCFCLRIPYLSWALSSNLAWRASSSHLDLRPRVHR